MRSFTLSLLSTVFTVAAAPAVYAQQQPAPAAPSSPAGAGAPVPSQNAASPATADNTIGEIVVTAQRRTETLQHVPVSVTAISGQELAAKRLVTATDLAATIPNLQAQQVLGEGNPTYSLRGITMADYSVNQQGPVATYFDDVYLGDAPLMPLGMYDLQRVEVLRGPQGTLYGKNTTGGAINFISQKPLIGVFGGHISVTGGNYNRAESEGAVNLPINNQLSARVAYTYNRADGWYKNIYPGQPNPDATNMYGVRASVLWQPTDAVDFVLRATTSLQNAVNYGIYAIPTSDGVGAGLPEAFGVGSSYFRTGIGKRTIDSSNAPKMFHLTNGVSLTSNWKVSDALTVTSVTAYNYGNLKVPEDADGSPIQVLRDVTAGSSNEVSEDLRLSSNFRSGPNFILGAYFNHDQVLGYSTYNYLIVLNNTTCTWPGIFYCIYRNQYNQQRWSYAAYADLNWDLGPLILRGGLRESHDDGVISGYTAQALNGDGTLLMNTIPGDPNHLNASARDSFTHGALTGKAGVDVKLPAGNLLYVNYSTGYRSPAFNAQGFFFPQELNAAQAETVTSYEVGLKTQWFARKLTLNGSAFYYDYRNQQSLSIDPNTLAQNLVNLPKSTIYGGEIEFVARPFRRLRINGGVGLLHTRIDEGFVNGADLRGFQLPNAPNVNLNWEIAYDIMDSEKGKLTIDADGTYTTRQYFQLFNEDAVSQGAYAVDNARLAYRTANDKYGVALWAKNIFNQTVFTAGIDATALGFTAMHLAPPRTFGVTLDGKF